MLTVTRGLAALALIAAATFASAQDSATEAPDSAAEAPAVAEMRLGAEDAPVTVVEYASYTCPHCASFHAESFDKLKADYIDTGKVNFVYREVYFDRPGLWASIVARCGENAEDRFFGITEMLYERQDDWARQSEPAEVVERLRSIGRTAGLTDSDLDACLTDAANAEALYKAYVENAEADGVTATPTFIIDGKSVSNRPWDELSAEIDAALGE